MRFTLAAIASLLAIAEARITAISVPDKIKPGAEFDVIIEASDYSSRIYDASITFGYSIGEGSSGAIGTPIRTILLGSCKTIT